MTVGALEQTPVTLVAKRGETGLLDLKGYGYGRFMALIAITLDTKSGFTLMAGPAGCTLLHLGHGRALIVGSGIKQLVVAVATGIHAEMTLMAKTGIVSKQDLFGRMAFAAAFYAKGGLVIMAGATRLALLHVSHGKALGSHASAQNGIMAVTAGKQTPVPGMTEVYNSGILDLKGNIRGGDWMTPFAI